MCPESIHLSLVCLTILSNPSLDLLLQSKFTPYLLPTVVTGLPTNLEVWRELLLQQPQQLRHNHPLHLPR